MFWHPALYRLTVRVMYGTGFHRRYQAVADLTDGLETLDVCCGDGSLANYLPKNQYRGVDLHQIFVSHCQRKGLSVMQLNIQNEPLPKTPCLVMMASLYQFIPQHKKIVIELIRSAEHRVIISEPIQNLATGKNSMVAWLAKRLADPVGGAAPYRFDEQSLRIFFDRFGFQRIIPNGRELIGVLDKIS